MEGEREGRKGNLLFISGYLDGGGAFGWGLLATAALCGARLRISLRCSAQGGVGRWAVGSGDEQLAIAASCCSICYWLLMLIMYCCSIWETALLDMG